MKKAIGITDAEVEVEITRLLGSEEVKLAKLESREKNRRRQYLYSLRTMEKRGKELMQLGYTCENLRRKMFFPEEAT